MKGEMGIALYFTDDKAPRSKTKARVPAMMQVATQAQTGVLRRGCVRPNTGQIRPS